MEILKQNILLIEDNEDDAFFISLALSDAGFEHPPYSATGGEEAIAYLAGEGVYADRVRHPIPGFVLLDLQLPGKHGFDVLRWLSNHAALRQLVVVVLTSSPHSKDIGLAYKLGARSFLVKPLNQPQLRELIEFLKTVRID